MNVIETKQLTKYYGKSRGIIDVDISVQDGEIYGFIGPNGAGKSTTIRVLLSLIFATSGSATIFGKDIVQYGPEIRAEIGYLPSEVFYYEKMRVRELLDYSASFYKKDCSARIAELAQIMDLDMDKKIDDLSYGNKKKVGIVQGLLHSPKLIILDEPTGGLDPLMQQKFFDLINEENKKGVTVFLSSHILSEVQRLCNRVAIIKEGKIIQVEKMSDLSKSNYSQFRLVTNKPLAKDYFKMDGVTELKTNEQHVSFLFKGDLNMMVKRISELDLQALWVEEPDLEDIFLHFYQ